MKKIILLILDGFGLSDKENGNAVKNAKKPILDELMAKYPCAELKASGEAVGLPKGQMGNSEVGHMTIGTGRITPQALTLINEKIKNKEMFENDLLISKINGVKEKNSTLHLVGMLSNGGVHSSINHFYAALAIAKLQGLKKVSLHLITDGRDTPDKYAISLLEDFNEKTQKLGIGTISSICGRYFAMDRDNNWDRTKKYFELITRGYGHSYSSALEAIEVNYKNNVTDEFINPSIINGGSLIRPNDTVLFLNYRPDRMKQLIDAFTELDFNAFQTMKMDNIEFFSLYDIHPNVESMYQREEIKNTLGEYISALDYKQARIAETEKYNHVTHFFDGEKDIDTNNYSKYLVPSPKVATYDLKPEMSIGEVTQTTLDAIENDYDFILVNFANPDMVGHTGNYNATKDAIEICDFCTGKILESAEEHFYDLIITADHGNAEMMVDENGNVCKTHTANKVPFIICNSNYKIKPEGELKDIAPTIIDMYEITKPLEMTGESLILKDE